MDAPAVAKQVELGPGLSVAAQAAAVTAAKINADTGPMVPDVKPVDVVDRSFVESIGIRTSGWKRAGKAFWKEHSTQFWTAAAGLQLFLISVQGDIPAEWERIGQTVNLTLAVLGIILKLRIQPSVQVDAIRQEVKEKTP